MFKRPVVLFSLAMWIVVMCLAIVAFPGQASAAPFLDAADAFSLKVDQPASPGGETRLTWSIAPGYYLYQSRISVTEGKSHRTVPLTLPAGDQKDDPNFGIMEVYHKAVTATIPPVEEGSYIVNWQGCAEAGLCYPPQSRTMTLGTSDTANQDNGGGGRIVLSDSSTTTTTAASLSSVIDIAGSRNSDGGISRLLNEKSLYWTLPLFLVLGIGLAFTPCVLPMVPIVSSIVIGQSASQKQTFFLSLAFVIPMALTYAGLGVAAAVVGANLQAALQNQWMILAFGTLFALLALPMFGVFTLQLPAFLRDRLDRASQQRQRGKYLGVAGMGVISALMVGPCMTAPLAGTLLYIAQSGDAVKGGFLLFVMGLGMGLPLVAVSVLGARSLPKPGMWMERVKGAFGFLMLGVAIWMVERVLPATFVLLLWGAWLIGIALTLLHIVRGQGNALPNTARISLQCVAVLSFLWGASSIIGAAGGATDPLQPIAFAAMQSHSAEAVTASVLTTVTTQDAFHKVLVDARESKQAVLVDFYADWCVSCKSIEKEVFGSPSVVNALSDMKLIRVDVTDNNPSVRALMRELGILGPPTVMLFDKNGMERRDARLVGEFRPADLLQRVNRGATS